jgi:hypothetical protein
LYGNWQLVVDGVPNTYGNVERTCSDLLDGNGYYISYGNGCPFNRW